MAALVQGQTKRSLHKLDRAAQHEFIEPVKRINEGEDVTLFLTSRAYTDILAFLLQLNAAMFPRTGQGTEGRHGAARAWEIQDASIEYSDTIQRLQEMLQNLTNIIGEAPPATGPRRFGNVSFRKWHELVEERSMALLDDIIPTDNAWFTNESTASGARGELKAYLLGSFGSAQRLDYGTGHELSFLAFLGCLWKLDLVDDKEPGVEERGIVLGVVEPYLQLIRRLIKTYNLEPAGSHGVWGLDDHFFLPYIFGSAQLSPPVSGSDEIPEEGSLPDAPDPADVIRPSVVERERKTNMYFSAIGFVYDMKKGPFWEHSPILYDISGVKAGWAKINKGLLKMYNAEVLSKFPVVQHFPFGSLFQWESDPNAPPPQYSLHTSSQPSPAPVDGQSQQSSMRVVPQNANATKVPWQTLPAQAPTTAPWATRTSSVTPRPPGGTSTKDPIPNRSSAMGPPANVPTRVPWASARSAQTASPGTVPYPLRGLSRQTETRKDREAL